MKSDDSGASINRLYFLYIVGSSWDFMTKEPTPATADGIANFTLVFGILRDNIIISSENVSRSVLPFHYNFVFDGQGNVYVAFISANYTLSYGVRDAQSGEWTITELTIPSNWYAFAPTIRLGSDDDPRIVYAAHYNENAGVYWNTGNELFDSQAIHYMRFTDGEWQTYDITDNNNPEDESHRTQIRLQVNNPNLEFRDHQAFVTYSKRNQLAVKSSIQLIQFPENLPADAFDIPGDFFASTTTTIAVSTIISTIYTRSDMQFLDNLPDGRTGFVAVFGSLIYGGANLVYFESNTLTGDVLQLIHQEIDLRVRSRAVWSMDIEYNRATQSFVFVWSVQDIFDSAENQYTFDVRIGEVGIEAFADYELDVVNGQLVEFTWGRLTDTTNLFHIYPNLEVIQGGENVVSYISNDPGYTTRQSTFGERTSIAQSTALDSQITNGFPLTSQSPTSATARKSTTTSVGWSTDIFVSLSGIISAVLATKHVSNGWIRQ